MPQNDKIKMTKQEFEELYEVIEDNTIETETIKTEETEPEFLTEEEEEYDTALADKLNWNEEKDK